MTKVLMTTNKGDIEIELNAEQAPNTVKNFLDYVSSDFYNGTIFHRVIKDFMIQGGGFTTEMAQKKTADAIKNEANNGLVNDRGTIAMARTMDPHSATSQFFINLNDNESLNFCGKTPQGWGYTVFGQVTKGMETVEEIGEIQTGRTNGMTDVPSEFIVIEKITLAE